MTMARGWESKSVESQIEDRRDSRPRTEETSREDLALKRKRESLESSRRGLLRELESATSDLRRASLSAALQHIETELKNLG